MDYILHKINKRINFYEDPFQPNEMATYYRVKIEYILTFTLSYLWNKNFDKLTSDSKEYIINKIFRPSIGSIVDISRKLDEEKEIFSNKQINEAFNNYPKFRNDSIGHGYVHEDSIASYLNQIRDISNNLLDASNIFMHKNYDLILVQSVSESNFSGINFKPNGNDYLPWRCPVKVHFFELDNIYALDENQNYLRLSPFIHILNEDEFYLFRDVEERLLGRIRYNRILKTGTFTKGWNIFNELSLESDGFRRKSANGTIINIFENNYKKYIDVGTKQKIKDFLLKNRSSVYATVWGHGGVGKTAAVQSICEDLANSDKKYLGVFQMS